MKLNTIQRKKARGGFERAVGREEVINRMYEIIRVGKQGLDGFIVELRGMVAEAIMDMEREEWSGRTTFPSKKDSISVGLSEWFYLRRESEDFGRSSEQDVTGGFRFGSIGRHCWKRVIFLEFLPARCLGMWWR